MVPLSHILVGLVLVYGDLSPPRMDIDGIILSTAVLRMEKMSWKGGAGPHSSGRPEFPKKFLDSFVNAFLPRDASTNRSLKESINELAAASVDGAINGCGICFAVLGFIRSIMILPEIEDNLSLLGGSSSMEISDFKSVEHYMYTAAASRGSTWGILAQFQLDTLHGTDAVRLCRMYEVPLGHLAQESLTTDVVSDLMGPSDLDFASNKPPLYFMTTADIQLDDERFGYITRMMRENAEFLQSSLLFSPGDLIEMMGFDGEFTEEEIVKSMEGVSSMTDDDIANEIIDAIHTDMYNSNAIAYNDALQLIERDPHSCIRGLHIFRDIIQKHNLFVKVIFFLVKVNWYRHQDPERALLLSLILSSVGVLPGTTNAIKLIDLQGSKSRSDVVNEVTRFRPPVLGLSCSQLPIHEERVRIVASCLELCDQKVECRYSTFDRTTSICREYDSCDFLPDKPTVAFHEKIDTSLTFLGCSSDEYRTYDCLNSLNYLAARIHNHSDSIHRFMRGAYHSGDLDASLYWARCSADIGAAEGKFYQALLEQTAWPGHEANVSRALQILWDMLRDSFDSQSDIGAVEEFTGAAHLDALEHEAILEISALLGLPDYEIGHRPEHQSQWPERIAAIVGLIRTYSEQNTNLLRKLVTLAAIIPLLIFLVSRRANLLH